MVMPAAMTPCVSAVIGEIEKFHERRRLDIRAQRERIPAGDQEVWVRQRYDAWVDEQRRKRNPAAIRREIETNLGYFHDVFAYFFTSVGQSDEELRLEVRLGATEGF